MKERKKKKKNWLQCRRVSARNKGQHVSWLWDSQLRDLIVNKTPASFLTLRRSGPFRNLPQLCLALCRKAYSQRDQVMWFFEKMKLHIEARPPSACWSCSTVLKRQRLRSSNGTNWNRWPSRLQIIHLELASGNGNNAIRTNVQKKKSKTLLWLYTAHHTSFNHNNRKDLHKIMLW